MATQVASSASAVVARSGGMSNRRWALWASYFFLFLFIILFLFPPYYMLITSFKTNEEISSMAGNPWIINAQPTLESAYQGYFTLKAGFLPPAAVGLRPPITEGAVPRIYSRSAAT